LTPRDAETREPGGPPDRAQDLRVGEKVAPRRHAGASVRPALSLVRDLLDIDAMIRQPVQLRVEPSPMSRAHVVVRIVLLLILASIGCSSLYWLLYLALPAIVAVFISRDGAEGYLAKDAPGVVRILRLIAAIYAYLWLLTDDVPSADDGGAVELTVDVGGRPTVSSALVRLLTSFPALLLLALLSVVAVVVWVLGALTILATGRVPTAIAEFITMKLTYQFRLVAYHLSLVDAYPSLTDVHARPDPRPNAV
jgi:hypothetical protein